MTIKLTGLSIVSVVLASGLPGQAAPWEPIPMLEDRQEHAMAYDPVRQRVVLFGGSLLRGGWGVAFGDTWEWDGRVWHHRQTPVAPSPRNAPCMAFDPIRQTILLFGGVDDTPQALNDTWEWDGQTWRELQPQVRPAARWRAMMVSDPRRGRIWLHGGIVGVSSLPSTSDETWEWNGTTWIQHHPHTNTGARWGGAIAFDRNSGLVVMFGGFNFGPRSNETCLWDGRDWTMLNAPGPTWGPVYGMATDPVSGKPLVHSATSGSTMLSETWSWDGQRWTRLASNTPLGPRYPGLVEDGARGQVLFFGSSQSLGAPQRDTWAWDGTAWKQIAAAPTLPAGFFLAAHDAARDEFVLTGLPGSSVGTDPLETWVLSEGRYEQKFPRTVPPARRFQAMCYHAGSGQVVLFGGFKASGPSVFGDLWLWDGSDWREYRSSVSPPAGIWHAVYDGNRDRVVLIGQDDNDVWEWDPQGWTRIIPTGGGPPLPRSYTGAAYDPLRRRIVTFGDRVSRDTTWEWDGTAWHNMQSATTPPGAVTIDRHLAYVPWLRGVLMFDPDTWLWDGVDWKRLPFDLPEPGLWASAYDVGRQEVVGFYWFNYYNSRFDAVRLRQGSLAVSPLYPRPGESAQLRVQLPGQAGNPFLLGLAMRQHPGVPLRVVPGVGTELLTLQPDPLLALSLQVGLTTLLDASGAGTITLPIPNDPFLLWFRFHAAGITLTPGVSVGAITNPVTLEVVR